MVSSQSALRFRVSGISVWTVESDVTDRGYARPSTPHPRAPLRCPLPKGEGVHQRRAWASGHHSTLSWGRGRSGSGGSLANAVPRASAHSPVQVEVAHPSSGCGAAFPSPAGRGSCSSLKRAAFRATYADPLLRGQGGAGEGICCERKRRETLASGGAAALFGPLNQT